MSSHYNEDIHSKPVLQQPNGQCASQSLLECNNTSERYFILWVSLIIQLWILNPAEPSQQCQQS